MPRVNSVNSLSQPRLDGGAQAPKINPRVHDATAAAGAAIGKAVASFGSAIGGIASAAGNANAANAYSDATTEFAGAASDIGTDVTNNPGERGVNNSTIAPRMQKSFNDIVGRYGSSMRPKQLRRFTARAGLQIKRAGNAGLIRQTTAERKHFQGKVDKDLVGHVTGLSQNPTMEELRLRQGQIRDRINANVGHVFSQETADKMISTSNSKLFVSLLGTTIQKDSPGVMKLLREGVSQGLFDVTGSDSKSDTSNAPGSKQTSQIQTSRNRTLEGINQREQRANDFSGGGSGGTIYHNKAVPSSAKRSEIVRGGGRVISLDANSAKDRHGRTQKIIAPGVVIPKGADAELRKDASAYTKAMAEHINEKFGRNYKTNGGRVWTSGRKADGSRQRGRGNTIHTEAFGMDDAELVAYFGTAEGAKAHADIIARTIGKTSKSVVTRPHQPEKGQYGASGSGTNEYRLSEATLKAYGASKKSGPVDEDGEPLVHEPGAEPTPPLPNKAGGAPEEDEGPVVESVMAGDRENAINDADGTAQQRPLPIEGPQPAQQPSATTIQAQPDQEPTQAPQPELVREGRNPENIKAELEETQREATELMELAEIDEDGVNILEPEEQGRMDALIKKSGELEAELSKTTKIDAIAARNGKPRQQSSYEFPPNALLRMKEGASITGPTKLGNITITAAEWNALTAQQAIGLVKSAGLAYKTHVTGLINTVKDARTLALTGQALPSDELNAMSAAVKELPSLQQNFEQTMGILGHIQILRSEPAAVTEGYVNEMRRRMQESGTKLEGNKVLKSFETLLKNQRKGQKDDPIEWARKSGTYDIQKLDIGNKESWGARREEALAVADKFQTPVKYFEKSDIEQIKQGLDDGTIDTLDFTTTMRDTLGQEGARDAWKELYPTNPGGSYLGGYLLAGGDRAVAKDVVQGWKLMAGDGYKRIGPSAKDGQAEIGKLTGDTFNTQPLFADTHRQLTDAAYESWARRTGTIDFDSKKYSAIAHGLIGMTMDGAGNQYGGITNMSTGWFGTYTVVAPPGVKASRFDYLHDKVTLDMLPSVPTFEDGIAITQEQFEEAILFSAGSNRYRLGFINKQGQPEYYDDGEGGDFIYNFNDVRPELEQRYDHLFN